MPGMDGGDTLREMARRNIAIPVIGISGDSCAAEIMMNLGARAFLSKPILEEQLLAAVADPASARMHW